MIDYQALEAFIVEVIDKKLGAQPAGDNAPVSPEYISALIDKKLADFKSRDNFFLTPEQLCERWQITGKALEKWRVEGKPPIYIKVQATRCAAIRYPLQGDNGILDVEAKWLRSSTTDRGARA